MHALQPVQRSRSGHAPAWGLASVAFALLIGALVLLVGVLGGIVRFEDLAWRGALVLPVAAERCERDGWRAGARAGCRSTGAGVSGGAGRWRSPRLRQPGAAPLSSTLCRATPRPRSRRATPSMPCAAFSAKRPTCGPPGRHRDHNVADAARYGDSMAPAEVFELEHVASSTPSFGRREAELGQPSGAMCVVDRISRKRAARHRARHRGRMREREQVSSPSPVSTSAALELR